MGEGHPGREPAHPVEHPRVGGVEQVRAVAMHPDAVRAHLVIGVAGDVRPLVDHVHGKAGFRQASRMNGTGESRADD